MVEAVSANVLPPAPTRRQEVDNPSRQGSGAPDAKGPERTQPDQLAVGSGAFDDEALDRIAARLVAPDARLAISQDDFIQRFIYTFVSVNSGDVIRQYPHERVVESLHAIEEMRERFIDKQA